MQLDNIKKFYVEQNEQIWKVFSLSLVTLIFLWILRCMYFPYAGLLFPNSDFEMGNFTNWKAEGSAFANQPTYGDNSWYRNGGASHVIGNYWVGTAENHRTQYDVLGKTQGDKPTGKLVSNPFTISKNKIIFLIGGGDYTDKEAVSLVVDGKKVLTEKGKGIFINGEIMRRVTWDVSQWRGKKALILIEDFSSGNWGHINADDFRYGGFNLF